MKAKKSTLLTPSDVVETVTVTATDLVAMISECSNMNGMTIRLRYASDHQFHLEAVKRVGQYGIQITVGSSLTDPNVPGGTYWNIKPNAVIDVGLTIHTKGSTVKRLQHIALGSTTETFFKEEITD